MAGMARDQDLVGARAREVALPVGEVARLEGRIDADLVFLVGERQELPVGETEAPRLFIVGRPIWDPVRGSGRVQIAAAAAQDIRGWGAVVENVEVGALEVHALAAGSAIGVPDVPFLRHGQSNTGCQTLLHAAQGISFWM
jgi:hypothetical protein